MDVFEVSFRHTDGTGRPGAARNDVWLSELRDGGRNVDTQSFQGTTTDVDWLCWPWKSEGDGPMKLARSSGLWHDSKPVQNHRCYANKLNRFGDSGGLSCATRAFACSLVDLRVPGGADGNFPLVCEVVGACAGVVVLFLLLHR